jgi:hypothetical protein
MENLILGVGFQHLQNYKKKRSTNYIKIIKNKKEKRKMKRRTWVPDSGVDGIALLQQELDQQRSDEAGAADDARSLLPDMLSGHGCWILYATSLSLSLNL